MKILLISDQKVNSDHSAVEGLFYKAINKLETSHCDIVYFSEQSSETLKLGKSKLQVPKKAKHASIINYLKCIIELDQYDFVVVRNYFATLKQFLNVKAKYNFKVGFWESFPHGYRRYEEANRFGKSYIRKSIEWLLKSKYQKHLISQSDFYLPISHQLQNDFYPNLMVASYPLSMGVDIDIMPEEGNKDTSKSSLKAFVYTGTIDRLRNFDVILDAFLTTKKDYQFFIYTTSDNDYVTKLKLKSQLDSRIQWSLPLKRDDLFKVLNGSDIAVGIFPETKTYRSASPTKTIEYYAIGLPTLLNHIPEYDRLFDEHCAYFCSFNQESIRSSIEKIIDTSKAELVTMGRRGREIIIKERTYDYMAKSFVAFLRSL
ncbi:glycosyltransferase [Thiotrichales bacterium 19S3-7]|nr:glycosyltransferase [Thiotrichales bacterium 19S3-7]MCF6801484.1 glycosyltransferase [Thiotrichales bacterium 19S3-11]